MLSLPQAFSVHNIKENGIKGLKYAGGEGKDGRKQAGQLTTTLRFPIKKGGLDFLQNTTLAQPEAAELIPEASTHHIPNRNLFN